MGQYYMAINLDKKEYLEPYGGLKLMEHSWCGNNTTNHFTNLIARQWLGDRIIWAGDYTENNLFVEDMPNRQAHSEYGPENIYTYAERCFKNITKNKKLYNSWKDGCKKISLKKECDYFVDFDSRQYLILSGEESDIHYYPHNQRNINCSCYSQETLKKMNEEYILHDSDLKCFTNEELEQMAKDDLIYKVEWKVYAPALLLCCSFGGGGSYHGSNELAGTWNGHHVAAYKNEKEFINALNTRNETISSYTLINPNFKDC